MKKSKIHVEVMPMLFRRHTLIRAKVSGHPHRRKRNGTVFFEVPAELSDWLSISGDGDDVHDSLLRALIYSAMEARRDIVIHGRVSGSLLTNLTVYQDMICAEMPEYRPVDILADEVISPTVEGMAAADGEAIMGFSGGLDSIYTLLTHQKNLSELRSRRIPTCLFVHGFDIPLRDRAYDRAFDSAQRITSSLSSRLFPIRTNLKRMLPSWRNSFGAALTAVLSLFERRYSTALIASSYADDNPHALRSGYGSTPQIDPLLSSHSFTVLHDVGKNRAEKSEILSDFHVGRQNLRVCWAGDDLATNCGNCGKCILQMISMRLAGVTDLSAFRNDLKLEVVSRIKLSSEAFLKQWKTLIQYAIEHGRGEMQLVRVMQRMVDQREKLLAAGQIPDDAPRRAGDGVTKRMLRWTSRVLGQSQPTTMKTA